ncbi:MAG TPA: hypothetical protein VFC07_02810 [Verrucomicrobiae bacterium]|nr:hypothetical protein [Verrucomicrobiae bacterium]
MIIYQPAKRAGHYFQVPLCAFAFGASHKERFEAIIAFGIMQAGEKRWNSLDAQKRQEYLAAVKKAGRLPLDYDKTKPGHIHAVVGADVTNVRLSSISALPAQHGELSQFKHSFASRHGPDPLVRLKSTLVFEARDGNGVTPRELAVLAAIFSVVGKKQGPVLITQNRIRRRALGYKTQAVLDAELSGRKDGTKPLTDWQLRSTLERLHIRKFFARVTYGCRQTYYSHRMKDDQLRSMVTERKTFPFASKLLARINDKTMTDAIRNQRAIAAGKPPPKPNAGPLVLPGKFDPDQVF